MRIKRLFSAVLFHQNLGLIYWHHPLSLRKNKGMDTKTIRMIMEHEIARRDATPVTAMQDDTGH